MPRHRRLSLADLLNRADEHPESIDIREPLMRLIHRLTDAPVMAPPHIAQWLLSTADVLPRTFPKSPVSGSSVTVPLCDPLNTPEPPLSHPSSVHISPEIRRNVRLNRKTTLSTLYVYNDITAFVEYPETHPNQPVGYLFRQDLETWYNPARNFVYSLGEPSGRTREGFEVYCDALVDEQNELVPCIKRHYTCQGSKICPEANSETLSAVHQKPSLDDVRKRLMEERETQTEISSPTVDVFQKTAAFITALRKVGCRAPRCEETCMNAVEQEAYTSLLAHQSALSRGYAPPEERCEGRILLEFDQTDKAFVRCEHYSPMGNRDHFIQYLENMYDIDYLDAHFNEDSDELDRIERLARRRGYGPLAECSTVTNFSSQRIYCPKDHRDTDQQLMQLVMKRLLCEAAYHIYEPLPAYRRSCPWVLVVCKGVHPHPIPIPQKTPPLIRSELDALLKSLDNDLADLTPRRFLRHPLLKSFLRSRLPDILQPTLSDLHLSLANRSHLKHYIDQAKENSFPKGTGWEGVQHLKRHQDDVLLPEEHYIRRILEISQSVDIHEDDESDDTINALESLRIVVCMSKEGSRRLLAAQYIQSDIGFKRVVGFHEFEIACMDRRANTSIIFCRVFLNRQTAVAHQTVLAEIEDIVLQDTGSSLRWRHIHAASMDETEGMIIHWGGDQHGGQAKGIGLHLQKIAQKYPAKRDLHEPHRFLHSLSPYEHLHRIFRLCTVHGKRNIRKLLVPEDVRNLMRSLMCMEHDDWDGTLAAIMERGGKAAIDWVQDKLRSQFVFQAMCWEKSHIPIEIWRAGDTTTNLIESAHSDVNREGTYCTLVGGIKKGQVFDTMKMRTLQASEEAGIHPSYLFGHTSENATKNLKRKFNAHHHALDAQDTKIEQHNKKLCVAHEKINNAHLKVIECAATLGNISPMQEAERYQRASESLNKAQTTLIRAEGVYWKQVDAGKALVQTGSGKLGICLPAA